MTEFKGTGVALATPMNADGSFDFNGLKRLVEHTVVGGSDYLVILGTTGESPTVYPEERFQIIDTVVEANAGRLPLVLGFSGNFTDNLVRKLEELDDPRLAGILISSPHYNKPSQEGIYQHYKAAAEASKYPIILYNVPHRTSSNMSAETTLRLAALDNVVATKEASGDLEQCKEIIDHKPEGFLVLSGDDEVTKDIIGLGGAGVISVVANAYPKAMSEMVNAALSGNHLSNEELDTAMALCGKEGNPTSVKAALVARDICGPFVRLPLTPPSEGLVDEFKALSGLH